MSTERSLIGQPFASQREEGERRSCAPGLVERGVDPAPGRGWNAGDALELLRRRGEEALGGAEMLHQRALARGADTGQGVEDRLPRPCVAALPVEAEGEAVRLVPDALEELKAGRVPLEDDRLGAAGNEHLLLALREGDDGDARQL